MQGDVQEQGADHAALRSSLVGRCEPFARLEHTRLQPIANHFPGREWPDHRHQVGMIDSIERRRQVSVENPLTLRGLALQRLVDGLDRIVASTARAKPI